MLECFLKRSAEARIGSPVVEILADTAVALASANVQLVARKIITKLCLVSEIPLYLNKMLNCMKLKFYK